MTIYGPNSDSSAASTLACYSLARLLALIATVAAAGQEEGQT